MIGILNSILASLDPKTLKTLSVGKQLISIRASFDVNGKHTVVLNVYEDVKNKIIFELFSSLQETQEEGIWFYTSQADVIETTKRFIRNVGILE